MSYRWRIQDWREEWPNDNDQLTDLERRLLEVVMEPPRLEPVYDPYSEFDQSIDSDPTTEW